MPNVLRPIFSVLVPVSLVLAACSSSGATPPRKVEPAQKTEPAAAPKTEPAAKSEPAASKPAAAPASADWDKVVAAAKAEKTLTLATHAGSGYEKFVEAAKKGVPDLNFEATTMRASDYVPRVIAEQRNGQFLWDMHVGPLSNVFTVLQPADGLEPIEPFLEPLPADIKDDGKWFGGFKLFTDPAKPMSFVTTVTVAGGVYINHELVPADEIKTPDDLLNPKWKGKIAVYDPTVSNGGGMSLAGLLGETNGAFLRKLVVDQDIVYVETARQVTEWVAQGRYPLGFGLDDTYLKELQGKGVGAKVERDRTFGSYYLTNGVSVLRNPPHPNAAKLFLAWLLSQPGQDAWAQLASVDMNSRRKDVQNYHPNSYPDYNNIDKLKSIQGTASGDAVLKETLEITNSKR